MRFDVLVEGSSILGAINGRLISLQVSDKAGTSSDSASLTIDNSDGLVPIPPAGRRMSVAMDGAIVFEGTVDKVRLQLSRQGRTIHVTAKGYDVTGKAKQPQNRTFKDKTILEMLEEAGAAAGVTDIRVAERIAQIKRASEIMDTESFAAFGERLARQVGGVFKLRPTSAVMADRNAGQTAGGSDIPPLTAAVGVNLHGCDIDPFSATGRYSRVVVRYRDREAGAWREVVRETGVEGADADAVASDIAPDKQAAEDLATEMVEKARSRGGAGTVVIEATPLAVSGGTINLVGAGQGADGTYQIEGVTHTLSRASGSITSVQLANPKVN